MAKKELFKRELFHDEYDSFDDEDFKSPKKAKKETNPAGSASPDARNKHPRPVGNGKREWTVKEESELIDCLGDLITVGLAQAVKERPLLAARTPTGCLRHWIAWRRKLETTLLGAPTVDGNGKKLPKQNAAEDSA